MEKYTLKFFKTPISLPHLNQVSAVFLIAFDNDQVLSCQNERGWDIPGGHVEPGESLIECLQREVEEEAGASFDLAIPFATLAFEDSGGLVMLFYATKHVKLKDFKPLADAFARGFKMIPELLNLYQGDKELLNKILQQAKAVL